MAPTTGLPRLTPLAALLDTYTRLSQDKSLGTYLALARTPGTGWKSFDDIADDLTAMVTTSVLTRPLNRVTIRTFAAAFGIPDTRYVDGRSMPRPVADTAINAYVAALTERDHPDVDREAVLRSATEGQDRDRRLAQALKDSADGNTADLGDFTQYADSDGVG